MGPAWSMMGSSEAIPVYGTKPNVGLSPTIPLHAAGMRIDPPWSPPMPNSASPSDTRAPVPDEEPPAE